MKSQCKPNTTRIVFPFSLYAAITIKNAGSELMEKLRFKLKKKSSVYVTL